jgi:AcrR family transcriptional regulator
MTRPTSASPATQRAGASFERKLRTRDAIVSAAAQALAERGLPALTVGDILELAGVARATFYAHFSDKHDVTREVVALMWRRAASRYANFAAAPRHTEASVRAWMDELAHSWRDHHEEVVALLRGAPAELIQASDGYLDEFAAVLVGDGRHWRCRPAEAKLRAALLIVQLERAMLDLCRGAWQVPEEALLDTLSKLWLQALCAP